MVPSRDSASPRMQQRQPCRTARSDGLQVTQLDGNGGDSTGGRGFVLAPFTQITSQVDRTALRGIGTMPYYFVLWHTLWCSRIPRGTLWHRLLGRSLWNECISSSVSQSALVHRSSEWPSTRKTPTCLSHLAAVPLGRCPTWPLSLLAAVPLGRCLSWPLSLLAAVPLNHVPLGRVLLGRRPT